jgi:transposase-like protein
MTLRTDHIRATALALAGKGKLTEQRLADAIHVTPRQARQWIRTLRTEGRIRPAGTEPTTHSGPGHTLWKSTAP